jgi:hypothetical protein
LENNTDNQTNDPRRTVGETRKHMINDIRILQGAQALGWLEARRLLPRGEFLTLAQSLRGEEGLEIAETVKRVWQTFETMPKTYETEASSDPTAHLHFFTGSWDWWITEKDTEPEQSQAFGFVKSELCPDGEMGYISLPEITEAGAELDLYFTPAPVSKFKA